MKLFASLLIAAALVAPVVSQANEPAAPAVAKPDLAAGGATFAAKGCTACHGADGNSAITTNPKLAQQHPAYLAKQLYEFKSGKRVNAVMGGMSLALDDNEIRNVTAWLGSQKAKSGFAKDRELVAMGERIFRGGIADRQIPACAGCHAPNGVGIPDQYPRLAGQHADYISTQLMAFRESDPKVGRKNSVQMNQVAAKLNDREIKAVSDYIAGLR